MANADVLSIQLYSVRSLGEVDIVLDAAAGAGFRPLELIGEHLDRADDIRKKPDARGLKASSSHVGMDQPRDRPEAMLAAAATLDITEFYMPAVPDDERNMTAAGWRSLGRSLVGCPRGFCKRR